MSGQSTLEDRQLAMCLMAPKAFRGLQHGGARSAQGHRDITPLLHVAADAPHRAIHVLDHVGASQRAPRFGWQAEAVDGEDFVEAFQNAVAYARGVVFQPSGQIS